MNQQIRVLKTLQGYDAAISRLSALMDIDFSESSVEESEFKLLWLVIQSYENIVTPPVIPDPIDGILFVMEQKIYLGWCCHVVWRHANCDINLAP